MNEENISMIIKSFLEQRAGLLKKLEDKTDGFAIASGLWEQCKKEIQDIDEFISDILTNNK